MQEFPDKSFVVWLVFFGIAMDHIWVTCLLFDIIHVHNTNERRKCFTLNDVSVLMACIFRFLKNLFGEHIYLNDLYLYNLCTLILCSFYFGLDIYCVI